jgi:hypothetical protein
VSHRFAISQGEGDHDNRHGPETAVLRGTSHKGNLVQRTITRRAFVTALAMLSVPLFAVAQGENKNKEKDASEKKEKKEKKKEQKREDAKNKAKDAADDHDNVVDGPGTDRSQDRRQDRRRDDIKKD